MSNADVKNTLNVALIAQVSRRKEMRDVRDELHVHRDISITSRWLDREPETREFLASLSQFEILALRMQQVDEELADIMAADVVIVFTNTHLARDRHGRHVAFGYALGLGKQCFSVGPIENSFYLAPFHFRGWDEARLSLINYWLNRKHMSGWPLSDEERARLPEEETK